jgi:hypothetical protein
MGYSFPLSASVVVLPSYILQPMAYGRVGWKIQELWDKNYDGNDFRNSYRRTKD